MIYPLVRDLAEPGGPVRVPVAVTCRVLKIARQPYYRWLADPVTDADWLQAHRANALFDAHREDLEFGYRLLVDEARDVGQVMADRTAWRICSANGWWSVFGKPKAYAKARRGRYPGARGSRGPRLHRRCAEQAVADRHHRTPDRLDSSSRRNTSRRCWRCRVRSTRRRRRRCSSR